MKNILVPTDFSQCAAHAANAAAALAKRFDAVLHLLSTIPAPRNWAQMDLSEQQAHPAVLQDLRNAETMLGELKKRFPTLSVEVFCAGGSLAEVTAGYVRDHGIDLIVMGSHGASGKNEYFIGSNTQKVVRTIHCPVLVVKNPLEKVDFQNVVFASDFSEDELPSFGHFKNFIKHFAPVVHLVAIHTSPFDPSYPEQKFVMKPFVEACKPLTCKTHVFRDISVDEGIRSFAGEIGADLIAISNLHRHPLKRMLIGSNVEALVNHADLPILTIDFEGA